MYQYKMVQIPPGITVQSKKHAGNEAAAYLENVVNKHAANGWEFHRIDSLNVQVQPGCFGALSGQKDEEGYTYVITFRKEKSEL